MYVDLTMADWHQLISAVFNFDRGFVSHYGSTLHPYISACGIDYASETKTAGKIQLTNHSTINPEMDSELQQSTELQQIACRHLFLPEITKML